MLSGSEACVVFKEVFADDPQSVRDLVLKGLINRCDVWTVDHSNGKVEKHGTFSSVDVYNNAFFAGYNRGEHFCRFYYMPFANYFHARALSLAIKAAIRKKNHDQDAT